VYDGVPTECGSRRAGDLLDTRPSCPVPDDNELQTQRRPPVAAAQPSVSIAFAAAVLSSRIRRQSLRVEILRNFLPIDRLDSFGNAFGSRRRRYPRGHWAHLRPSWHAERSLLKSHSRFPADYKDKDTSALVPDTPILAFKFACTANASSSLTHF
jgi:hypothetical protein